MDIAVIDFETTGIGEGADRIIEVGALIVRDGVVTDSFAQLMDPGFRLSPFITSLTGITNAMVRGQPPPEQVMPELHRFLGKCPCVAHNAAFDSRFFFAEMDRAGLGHERPFFCSMLLARRLVPEAPNHQLGTLARHLRLETAAGHQAHRALDDARMTVALWNWLLRQLGDRLGAAPSPELIRAIQKKPKKAVAAYLAQLAGGERP